MLMGTILRLLTIQCSFGSFRLLDVEGILEVSRSFLRPIHLFMRHVIFQVYVYYFKCDIR